MIVRRENWNNPKLFKAVIIIGIVMTSLGLFNGLFGVGHPQTWHSWGQRCYILMIYHAVQITKLGSFLTFESFQLAWNKMLKRVSKPQVALNIKIALCCVMRLHTHFKRHRLPCFPPRMFDVSRWGWGGVHIASEGSSLVIPWWQ